MNDVGERFWQMDNRFWIIKDPRYNEHGSTVIGFIAKEELCCDGAEVQMDHPSMEVDKDELAEILRTYDSVLLWDMHTRDSLLMTRHSRND